jgi:hypothetical protein
LSWLRSRSGSKLNGLISSLSGEIIDLYWLMTGSNSICARVLWQGLDK